MFVIEDDMAAILGCQFKYQKDVEAVTDIVYIGFRIVLSGSGIWVSIAPAKKAGLVADITRVIEAGRATFNELESVLGKLQHYCRAIRYFRLYTILLYDAMREGYEQVMVDQNARYHI
jgi:hypothetical protein